MGVKPMRDQRYLLICSTPLLAVLILSGCRTEAPHAVAAAGVPTVKARVITVEAKPFAASIPVTGTLLSGSRVDVKAEIIGHVLQFDKKEGDPVVAGEIIVRLDEENFSLAVRQAESAVQVAEAGREKARVLAAHATSELDRAHNLI